MGSAGAAFWAAGAGCNRIPAILGPAGPEKTGQKLVSVLFHGSFMLSGPYAGKFRPPGLSGRLFAIAGHPGPAPGPLGARNAQNPGNRAGKMSFLARPNAPKKPATGTGREIDVFRVSRALRGATGTEKYGVEAPAGFGAKFQRFRARRARKKPEKSAKNSPTFYFCQTVLPRGAAGAHPT